MNEVFIAKSSAIVGLDGVPTRIKRGVTRVEAGHPLLKDHPDLFEPASEGVRFTVRDAKDRSVQHGETKKAAAKKAPAKKAAAKKAPAKKAAAKKAPAKKAAPDKPDEPNTGKTEGLKEG